MVHQLYAVQFYIYSTFKRNFINIIYPLCSYTIVSRSIKRRGEREGERQRERERERERTFANADSLEKKPKRLWNMTSFAN